MANQLLDERRFAVISQKLLSPVNQEASEALAELSALGDAAVFDRLLEGDRADCSTLIPQDKQHVFLNVLAMAPKGSKRAAKLRIEVTRIYVSGPDDCIDIDLHAWLSCFPNVQILDLHNVRVKSAVAHPKLESLELGGVDFHAEALAALAASPSLTQLRLWNMTIGGVPLVNMDCFRAATKMHSMTIVNHTLQDIRALVAMPVLESALFQHCRSLADISALEGHPSLRAVLLYGTLVDKEAVPKGLRRICNWSASPNLQKMLQQEPQKPPVPKQTFAKDVKASVTQIKKLLKSNDVAEVDQGLALAVKLGDAAVFTDLLGDAYYNEIQQRIVVSGFKGPTGTHALLGLIAHAPSSCAIAANIRRATVLRLEGPETGADVDRPIDLLHLEVFPDLTRLNISHLGPFVQRNRPPSFPALTYLDVDDIRGLTDLSFIAQCPNLNQLGVNNSPDLANVRWIEGHPRLDDVKLWGLSGLSSLEGLTRLPRLERLHVAWCSNLTQLGSMTDLPALHDVQLRSTGIADVAPLRGLPSLTYLRIAENDVMVSLAALSPHPRLERLSVVDARLHSLDGLEGFPKLAQLYLSRPGPITNIETLSKLPVGCNVDVTGLPKPKSAGRSKKSARSMDH